MPRKAPAITIKELTGFDEMSALYPLIRQLNPDMMKSEFNQSLKEMLAKGYRCIAAYQGTKMVGACGMWSGTRFWCGRYVEVDNVVVDKDCRSAGIGAAMMNWVEKDAKRHKCTIVTAACYTKQHAAHKFYFREKFIILGYYFVRKLQQTTRF